ncbi:DUF3581 domain-containing protein [Vibrio sp. SS-MA-C1-2]|uniref:DUF3581 family protein n=1 Tax=Vibrio sp. SS-MA-C1-2 TaxID=2908646 RepID=UPI001F3185E6|nr:DUF3581 family protein [Vibrio sp. SS-MA-C1-2]UJF17506.1 DUF3581 domain-containing protein [Vibrio sp. SS-MA-C1-2]
MFISEYVNEKDGQWSITRPQASHFAKAIANDFNPIHDEDATRFCVPGDLLFGLTLSQIGVSQSMTFRFAAVVNDTTELSPHHLDDENFQFIDQQEKAYLKVERQGECSTDQGMVAHLIKNYVRFSGENFPHILMPLMKDKGMMINPSRPLVMYEDMSIHFTTLDFSEPTIELAETRLDIEGKRGNVTLGFVFKSEGEVIGTGCKHMILGGLRPFVQEDIDVLVNAYNGRKEHYQIHKTVC